MSPGAPPPRAGDPARRSEPLIAGPSAERTGGPTVGPPTGAPSDATGAAVANGAAVAARVRETLVQAGVTLAVYLPDSVLLPITAALEAEPSIRTMVCSREDEGMAIAAGASLAGGLAVVLMEGSGVGFGGLILARSQVQRSGYLVIASHSPALGEKFDYHAASRKAGAGVLGGLDIPYVIPRSTDELLVCLARGLETVVGQRSVVGVLVPPFVLS